MKDFFKKSQVSIFIIIAIMIIILFVFLISSNSQNSKDNLNNIKKISPLDQHILPIKDKVDFCLDKDMKRALIVAGIHGGFIYNKGEYFTQPIIFNSNNIYNSNLIANLGLSYNNLMSGVLIHSQHEVYTPLFNSSLNTTINNQNFVVYPDSIQDEFEENIMDEFVKCIDLWNYKKAGFNVIYDDFTGRLDKVKPNGNLIFSGIDAKIGDKVQVIYLNKNYNGNVTNIIGNKKIEVRMIDQLQIEENINLNDIYVKNLESNVKVKINFDNNAVKANINFPIKIKRDNQTYSVDNIQYSINSDFMRLMKLSDILLNEKYNNRSLDFSNSDELNKIFKKYSPIFGDNFLNNLELTKIVLNNTPTYKKYIYSIKDNSGKILGSPYIFNFAYENHAPDIIILNNVYNGNEIYFVTTQNNTFDFNLNPFTHDKELIDIYTKKFIPQSYHTSDADFTLTSDGKISFTGYEKKNYNFNIKVSDGEAIREEKIVFSTGFPDNTNNKAAKECFDFHNLEAPDLSPIESDYSDKIFNYTDNLDFNHIFSYFINQRNIPNSKSWTPFQLKFFKSCLFDENQFKLDIKILDLNNNIIGSGNWDNNTYEIKNLPEDKSFKVNVSILNKQTDTLMTSPFSFEVYAADCLGPRANESAIALYGGDLSCCDLSRIDNDINSNTPKEENNMFPPSHKAINASFYFALNITNQNYDVTNVYLWDKLNGSPTAIYEGREVATCGKNFSDLIPNIDGVTGGNNLSFIENNIHYNLKKVEDPGKCAVKPLNNTLGTIWHDFNNDGTEVGLSFGLASLNTLSSLTTYNNLLTQGYVLADENYFGSTDNGASWNLFNPTFTSSNPDKIEVGKKFCGAAGQGVVVPNSGFYHTETNNNPQCTKYTFNLNTLSFSSSRTYSSSWSCSYSATRIVQPPSYQNANGQTITPPPYSETYTKQSDCSDINC